MTFFEGNWYSSTVDNIKKLYLADTNQNYIYAITFSVDLNTKFKWNPLSNTWKQAGRQAGRHDLSIMNIFYALHVKNT